MKIKGILKDKHFWIQTFIVILSAVFLIVVYEQLQRQPTTQDMNETIWETYYEEGYDQAVAQIVEFYGTDDEAMGIYLAVHEVEFAYLLQEISIEEMSLDKDRNYFDFVATFKNNSDISVRYIKYNIYLLDEQGNIIHNDWANWSGSLKSDASVQVDTMVDYIKDAVSYTVEIAEVSEE